MQTPFPFLAIESLAFWALLPAYPLVIVALVRKRRGLAGWLAAIALVHLGWTFEWVHRIEAQDGGHTLLRIVDSNLLAPHPSEALARELMAADADVIVVQELSDVWLAELDAAGAATRYPHRVIEPHALSADYFGVGIFSRLPLEASGIEHLPAAEFVPMAWADARIADRIVRIESVHAAPPAVQAWADVWEPQMAYLARRMERETAPRDRIVVLAGDFNASQFSFAHRRFLDVGMHEAHESVGRGTAVTWPNGVFDVPPMRLDHVYVHGATVRSVRELPAHTSDHSPILVELALP